MLSDVKSWRFFSYLADSKEDKAIACLQQGGFDVDCQSNIVNGQVSALHIAGIFNCRRTARALIL
jgi:hypothetical protein